MMKRNHSIFCALALAACCFLAGCANGETTVGTPPQEPTSTTDTQTTKVSYQLPAVDSVDEKTMTSAVKQWIETVYGIDLTGWEAYPTLLKRFTGLSNRASQDIPTAPPKNNRGIHIKQHNNF